MRAAMAACTVAGTPTSSTSARQTIATALAGQHPALGQVAHDLLGEERIAAARSAIDRRQLADRGIAIPAARPTSAAVSESVSGARAIVWASAHPRQRTLDTRGETVISTIDGVCGITVRKSASIDSLTASIQCASSIT